MKPPDKESQEKLIAKHLKSGGTISPLRALEMFSCMRLASRINSLRNKGMNIESKLITEGPYRFSRYKIAKK